MGRLKEAAENATDHRVIAARIEELDDVSTPFAGRRMDRSIVEALRGRAVGDVEAETRDAKGVERHLEEEAEKRA
jgi:molecular chaperone HscA